jgi:hypothetical protein
LQILYVTNIYQQKRLAKKSLNSGTFKVISRLNYTKYTQNILNKPTLASDLQQIGLLLICTCFRGFLSQ